MKFVYWVFMVIYVLSAAVQYNDPDPLVWMASYLIAAYLCYYRLRGKGNFMQFFMIGLLYILWGINQFPPQWEGLNVENMQMKTLNVELARESLGLIMCGIGMWLCMIRKPKE